MNRPESSYHQPYAPSPYSYTPNPSLSSHVSLDEEIKLSATPQQRELHESLAEIFAIIIALDYVEKAFVKDSIAQEECVIGLFFEPSPFPPSLPFPSLPTPIPLPTEELIF